MGGKIKRILQTNGIITGRDQIKTISKEPKGLELKHLHSGKVRETFEVDDTTLLIVTTDRWSAYDVKMPQGIPLKGRILNTMSVLNFVGTEQIIQNHLITSNMAAFEKSMELKKAFENSAEFLHALNGRSMLVRKAKPLPFEFVVRGFLYGSGLEDYNNNDGTVSGVKLPPGLVKASKLQEPIFTPATKAQVGHDENITYEHMEHKLGSDVAATLKEKSIALYKNRAEFAMERGLILADTKFEFGYIGEELALIDEVVTPDSSRLWPRRSYRVGFDQDSCNDKQYLRDYLIKVANWDKKSEPPILPDKVIGEASEKYVKAYNLFTGKTPRFVSVVMGSPTDMKYAVQAETVLEQLGVWYIANVRSAHRTPRALELYTEQTEIDPYIKLHISVAGMAAAQPGYIAAKSIKPVIGVPSEGSLSILGGLDAVFSMLQMPPYAGPVLTVGVKNGINAGIAAAQILAIEDEELRLRLRSEIRKPE